MEGLADPLASAGYQVVGVRLSGHGEREAGEANDWPAWERSVAEGFAALDASAPRALVGLSMGALLVLELAREKGDEVRAVVTLSPAVTLPAPVRAALWVASRALGTRGR